MRRCRLVDRGVEAAEDPAVSQRQIARRARPGHPRPGQSRISWIGRKAKRVAFQSLLAKLRASSTLWMSSCISMPGELCVTSAKRSASAPYSAVTRVGSMTFPFVLLISRAFEVAHRAVQIDGVERQLAHELEPEHDHPRHPEEEDVVAGLHHRRWVVAAQVGGVVGPAEGGERPETGGEPGVEHVGVLLDRPAAERAGGERLLLGDDRLAALLAVPDRDAVAPPELAGDASSRGCSPSSSGRRRGSARARSAGCRPWPPRWPAAPASSMRTNHCVEISGSTTVSQRWQWPTAWMCGSVRTRRRPAPVARRRPSARRRCACPSKGPALAFIVPSGFMTVDRRQIVALADLEVVRIVGRRHLDRAGAEGSGRPPRRPRSG